MNRCAQTVYRLFRRSCAGITQGRGWLLAALVLGSSLSAAPILTLEPATVDWGRQVENQGLYPFTFKVRNTGDQRLEITKVRPGCSCTKVELRKPSLEPGESTEMTGTLETKGIEGVMQKGIILTTNDPQRQTAIAGLHIRFPIKGQGLRIQSPLTHARQRDGALWAYPVVENCEAQSAIQILAMELPEGWDSPMQLPITVKPEDRLVVILSRKLEPNTAPEAFEKLPFLLITDSPKSLRVGGDLTYRPEPPAPATPAPAPTTPAGATP